MIKQVTYDIECYPNAFTFVSYHPDTNVYKTFEVSVWRNDWSKLRAYLMLLAKQNYYMVGYSNLYYDYPLLHSLLQLESTASAKEVCIKAYKKSKFLINSPYNMRNQLAIWAHEQEVKQIDLYKIWHFDNPSRSTSLKMLEFVFRKRKIQELPYDPNKPLTKDQLAELIKYNRYDVEMTEDLRQASIDAINLRVELGKKYKKYLLLSSDSSMGEHIMKRELASRIGEDKLEYKDSSGVKHIRKTKRDEVVIKDCLFDYVKFNSPEFNAILSYLKAQTIKETKGFFSGLDENELEKHGVAQYSDIKYEKGKVKNLNVTYGGINYVFGTGGLHASEHSKSYRSDDTYAITDVDVTSMYPSLAIENLVYPEHLSSDFCEVYQEIKDKRISYPKGSPMNAALKLALNAVYGKSNSEFSCFCDPKYTMTITLNGQLLLAMLAEKLVAAKFKIIQVNTDGITLMHKREHEEVLEMICEEWEAITNLQLEATNYKSMHIRDVNSYIAVGTE